MLYSYIFDTLPLCHANSHTLPLWAKIITDILRAKITAGIEVSF